MQRYNIDAVAKSLIGISGTFVSVALEAVSIIVSILAGLATFYFMYQSGRNMQEKRQAIKEDRENENR